MNKNATYMTTPSIFQLKGTMLAITVFEITHYDIDALTEQLHKKLNDAPEFFETIPMVLSVEQSITLSKTQLHALINLFKEQRIQLMAIKTTSDELSAMAKELGLITLPAAGAREKLIELTNQHLIDQAIQSTIEQYQQQNLDLTPPTQTLKQTELSDTPTEAVKEEQEENHSVEATDTEEAQEKNQEMHENSEPHSEESEATSVEQIQTASTTTQSIATKIITTPIRSGQQILALETDLIVTSSVSTGAELISNGNIHIYGNMRGRAIAGQNGNTNARVFCNKLTAELICIAGVILTQEELRRHPLWGAATVLHLEKDCIKISPL